MARNSKFSRSSRVSQFSTWWCTPSCTKCEFIKLRWVLTTPPPPPPPPGLLFVICFEIAHNCKKPLFYLNPNLDLGRYPQPAGEWISRLLSWDSAPSSDPPATSVTWSSWPWHWAAGEHSSQLSRKVSFCVLPQNSTAKQLDNNLWTNSPLMTTWIISYPAGKYFHLAQLYSFVWIFLPGH